MSDRHRSDPSDEDLVRRACAGDRGSLEQLLRRHHDRIAHLCRRLCVDRGDAEDATQEALISIVRGLPRFDGRAAFTTWSYRIATNACLDELRRRGRRPVAADPSIVDHSGAHTRSLGSEVPVDPADHAVQADERATLRAALGQLPDVFRLPVVLRDVAQMDYAEIADVLGLAPGTVRSRIARGRSKLAGLVELEPVGNQDAPFDVGGSEQQ